jgi:P-loop Domain of unknown function (DUF2791)
VSRSARTAIRRLRAGVVPAWEIERLSVGYQHIHTVVDQSLAALAQGKRPAAIFVRGEWGTGKTHLLSYIRATSLARGLASSKVDLNARSAPLNHPQRFYTQIMANIGAGNGRGLRQLMGSILNDPTKRNRVLEFAESGQAADLRWPLSYMCGLSANDETLDFGDEPAWKALLGADLGWADYTYKRDKAVARVGAVSRMLRLLGMGGLVLLFDEAETIDQLWNVRSRLSAYAVLGDLCHMDAVCCVFGITERFAATVRDDLNRGMLNYTSAPVNAQWFLRAWRDERFCVIEPPAIEISDAAKLADALLDLYRNAYPDHRIDRRALAPCIVEWARNPVRNPRRLIRMVVNKLDQGRGGFANA